MNTATRFGLCLLTALPLGLASLATQANELTPGLWEITAKLNSPAVPDAMRNQVRKECLTQAQAANPEIAMRDSWKQGGCGAGEVNRSGNTLHWSTSCKMPGSNTPTKIRGEMVLHNPKHYTTSTTVTGNKQSMTTHSEAKWLGACDK